MFAKFARKCSLNHPTWRGTFEYTPERNHNMFAKSVRRHSLKETQKLFAFVTNWNSCSSVARRTFVAEQVGYIGEAGIGKDRQFVVL